jgi:hypothetical protein
MRSRMQAIRLCVLSTRMRANFSSPPHSLAGSLIFRHRRLGTYEIEALMGGRVNHAGTALRRARAGA